MRFAYYYYYYDNNDDDIDEGRSLQDYCYQAALRCALHVREPTLPETKTNTTAVLRWARAKRTGSLHTYQSQAHFCMHVVVVAERLNFKVCEP